MKSNYSLKKSALITLGFVICFLLLYSCILFNHPPMSISADVEIDSKEQIIFTNYFDRIAETAFFKRDHYFLSGLHASEDSCIGKKCDRRVWEIVNELAFNNEALSNDYSLPASIKYGQPFTKLNEIVKPEILKMHQPYFISIGIVGINDNLQDKIYFSVDAHFMLIKDNKGQIHIKQSGKNGVKLKRIIKPE